MRTLTDHIVEGDSANHQLSIEVLDEPGAGGACHQYTISFESSNPATIGATYMVNFQDGPIKEAGVNGVTNESLLAIVIDRLRCFQNGPFSSDANEEALYCCKRALYHLHGRTRERIARGVEGKTEK